METYRIRVILFSALIRAATVITNRRSHFRERKVIAPFVCFLMCSILIFRHIYWFSVITLKQGWVLGIQFRTRY